MMIITHKALNLLAGLKENSAEIIGYEILLRSKKIWKKKKKEVAIKEPEQMFQNKRQSRKQDILSN